MRIALLFMSTESIHCVNSAWILVVLSSLFFISKIELLDSESLKKLNLLPLLFIVGAMSIGSVASETQAINLIKILIARMILGLVILLGIAYAWRNILGIL